MTHEHDFKRFPELTNRQMEEFYWDSPHKQIVEDIRVKVVSVHDGDTIRVLWEQRDFTFPIRLHNLAAPELNEKGGPESQSWLESQIMGEDVDIILSKQRVEKWGRLLADVFFNGMSMADESIRNFHSISWGERANQPFTEVNISFKEVENDLTSKI